MSQLPKRERTFQFESVGNDTGRKYEGKFTVKTILKIREKHQLELEKTILQADTKSPTAGLRGISNVLAELRVRVVDGPEWWKQSEGGADLDDENVLLDLYDKTLEQEAEWRKDLKEMTKTVKDQADQSGQSE